MHSIDPLLSTRWQARLDLAFTRRDSETILSRRQHFGPLRVQKPLYPEGPELCHAIILHPPSGIVGGDALNVDARIGIGANVLLTTPGAGKWYRSAGAQATQQVRIDVEAGGIVEWLPQESIVFSGANAKMTTAVDLAPGACFIGVETVCFGRRASGEQFDAGQLRLAMDITLDGQPLWHERGRIDGASPMLYSPVGLAGFTVCSTLLAAGKDIPPNALTACHAIQAQETGGLSSVTALPNLFIGRYLGHSAEAARHWFFDLWRVLRPALIDREAVIPRIWNT